MRNKNIPPSTTTAPNTAPTAPNTAPNNTPIRLNLTAAITGPGAQAKSVAQDKDEWQQLANGVVKPGRRRNKNLSGRSGRRRHHSDITVRKVGGYASDLNAIYAPPTETGEPAQLCVTRECTTTCTDPNHTHNHNYTRNVGGSTRPSEQINHTYIGGRGI